MRRELEDVTVNLEAARCRACASRLVLFSKARRQPQHELHAAEQPSLRLLGRTRFRSYSDNKRSKSVR